MKTAKLVIILLTCMTSTAKGDAFKCLSSEGNTVYQAQPCPPSTTQDVVPIEKMDPAKREQAEKRLADWEADFEAREAAEKKAEQERQVQEEKLAHIGAINHRANARQQNATRRSNRQGARNCRQFGTCGL